MSYALPWIRLRFIGWKCWNRHRQMSAAGIVRDISHLENLIDEMLTYARLDRPRNRTELHRFSPAEWLQHHQSD